MNMLFWMKEDPSQSVGKGGCEKMENGCNGAPAETGT